MSGGAARQMLMATTRRQGRVNHLLHKEISSLIEFESSDPRLHGLTVSAVEISPDLKHAHVYISILGKEGQAAAMAKLEENRVVLQTALAKSVVLK